MKLVEIVDDILTESASSDFLNIADELADKLEDELDSASAIQEEIVLSIVAYVMLSNGIMGLLSKLVKRISKKYDFGKGQAAAEKIENFVKANDKRFMFPIRKAVGLFTKDEKQINKVTHILFALVVLLMAFNAGIEVFDLIKDSEFMQSSVNSLRTAVGGTKVHALARTVTKLL
jgi:hypothetical protein